MHSVSDGNTGDLLSEEVELCPLCLTTVADLTRKDRVCALCVDGEVDDFDHEEGEPCIELLHGHRVWCQTKPIYDVVYPEAKSYLDDQQSYQSGDWALIRQLLTLQVSVEIEPDPMEKVRLSAAVSRLRTDLGATRAQRVRETGVGMSLTDLLRREQETASAWIERHRGERDWKYKCVHCGEDGVQRGHVPHVMFDTGSKKSVWFPEMLPLVKRYYMSRDDRLAERTDYLDPRWMEMGKPFDGGLSIPDVARIWNMSPIGVLYEIWAHARESGDARLPALEELVGFTYDIENPDTLRDYVPEGDWASDEFWEDVQEAWNSKKG